MPIYKYAGILRNGSKKLGVVTADSKKQAYKSLCKQGISVLSISKVWMISGISKGRELIHFFTYILFQIRCNVPILSAIASYIEVSDNVTIKAIFERIHQSISAGASLYDAFSAEHKIFGDIIPSLLQSAEISGLLDEAISSILIYLNFNEDIKRKIRGAAIYPAFVLITAIVAVGFCVSCLGPQVQDLNTSTNEHYMITDICLAIMPNDENFMGFIIAFCALIGSVFIIPKRLIIEASLCLPIASAIVKKLYEWNSCIVLYIAIKSNIDVLPAIELMSCAVDETPFKHDFIDAKRNIENGMKLSDALASVRIISPEVVHTLRIGEDSNRLVEILHNIVKLQNNNIEYAIKRLGKKISVIITVTTGVLIIVILLGLFYPLYNTVEMGG